MSSTHISLLKAAILFAGLFGLANPAIGQQSKRIGDYYGIGAEGTIGRGTDILPRGPSTRFDSYVFGSGGTRGMVDYRSGYAGVSAPSSPLAAATPYLTTFTYTPGDGYRYPLYYNPVSRSYFYYPVRR